MNSSVDSFANSNVTPRPVLPDDESNIPRHRISNSSSTDKIPAPPTRRESIASQSVGSQRQGECRRVLGDSLPRKVSRKASESSHQRGGFFSGSSSSSRGSRRLSLFSFRNSQHLKKGPGVPDRDSRTNLYGNTCHASPTILQDTEGYHSSSKKALTEETTHTHDPDTAGIRAAHPGLDLDSRRGSLLLHHLEKCKRSGSGRMRRCSHNRNGYGDSLGLGSGSSHQSSFLSSISTAFSSMSASGFFVYTTKGDQSMAELEGHSLPRIVQEDDRLHEYEGVVEEEWA